MTEPEDVASTCSAALCGAAEAVQPAFLAPEPGGGGPVRVCRGCAELCLVPGLAVAPEPAAACPLVPFVCAGLTLPVGSSLFAFGENIFAARLAKRAAPTPVASSRGRTN